MNISLTSMGAAVLALALGVGPSLAEPGRGHGNGHGPGGKGHGGHSLSVRQAMNCPPGLAKKSPACVPPGQVRHDDIRYGTRVGDRLRVADYVIIRDPRRYDLGYRSGWDYYRDDNRIYRVDSDTRRILAVLNLVDAFTN